MHREDPNEFDASQIRSWRVLLVEDDPDSLEVTSELLKLVKQRVVGVLSAEAALGELDAQPFDILITDINLPEMSGIELARQVTQRFPQMAIVVASGYGRLLQTNQPVDQQIDAAVLPKPFGLLEITRVLAGMSSRLASG